MSDKFSESFKLAQRIGTLALEKKANRVRLLDVHRITSMTDMFVICSGESDIQVKAITDHIVDEIAVDERPWNREGYDTREWVLLDYVNVIVHIFHETAREYYDLERLWKDAVITDMQDDDQSPSADKPLFDDL